MRKAARRKPAPVRPTRAAGGSSCDATGPEAYGGSRGPEGAGYFDGDLSAGHLTGQTRVKGPRPGDANLTDMPLRGPL